jgi:galactoside O-acetyltransferase
MNVSSFYKLEELKEMGLRRIGENVLISKKCSIYGAEKISIGDNVRVDDFCILSGDITIGNHVHISAYSALYGKGGIEIGDFCGISPRCALFSVSDDFSGEHMISPMVSDSLRKVDARKIIMKDYSQIGTNSTVLPGVTIGEGAVIGAHSLAKTSLEEWTINAGVPATKIKSRLTRIKELAEQIND